MRRYVSGEVYKLKGPIRDFDLGEIAERQAKLIFHGYGSGDYEATISESRKLHAENSEFEELSWKTKHKNRFPKIMLDKYWIENGLWSFRFPKDEDWKLAITFMTEGELRELYEFDSMPMKKIEPVKDNRLRSVMGIDEIR